MKNLLFTLLGLAVLIAGVVYFTGGSEDEAITQLTVPVSEGQFLMNVIATGELQAKRSEKIKGPVAMRANQIYQTSITNLVPEGTILEEGDFVASLDKTEVDTKIKEVLTEMDKI